MSFSSVVETVVNLYIDLPWFVPVKSAERQTVIELHAAVRHVQRGHGNGVFLSEALAESKINRGVASSPWCK